MADPSADGAFADAVIVAAGAGRRMGGLDKVMIPLGGRPALAWSVASMAAAQSVARIIVVTSAARVGELSSAPWITSVRATVVEGGARRQDSVARGLAETTGEVVVVHDGARPFASPALVDAVAGRAREVGAAIPVMPVVDSLKRVHEAGGAARASREGLFRAQTPQGARRELLREAVAQAAAEAEFGDEAEMLEGIGVAVAIVAGEPTNIKLTDSSDIPLAEALASAMGVPGPPTIERRYATATDSHPFGPQDGLQLGGLPIPDAPRLYGHSDGDAALHAMADALLAAAGIPDLGRQFPSSDPATYGASSKELLRQVVQLVQRSGWRPVSIDVSITAARPKLGGARLDAMRAEIGDLVGLPRESVAVKASTGNLIGSDGAGRSISATALVSVEFVPERAQAGVQEPSIGR